MEPLYPALTLLVGLLLGAAVAYRLAAARGQHALSEHRNRSAAEIDHLNERLAERDAQLTEYKRELVERRDAHTAAAEQRARYSEQAQRVPVLEKQLRERDMRLDKLRDRLRQEVAARAQAMEKNRRLAQLERQLELREAALKEIGERLAAERARASTLATRLEEQEKQGAERLEQLEQARVRMGAELENLANRILEDIGRKFSAQNRNQIGELLGPLREQLDGFRGKVEAIHLDDARERSSLREQVNQLRELNQRINQEAINLTRALKGSKKAQGDWGELVLERVLEQSGLRKGVEYRTQTSFRDADGNLLRPDVVIHLPEGRDVVVDSKVSLAAWHAYVNAADETARDAALREHLKAVRAHIDGLAGKDYGDLPGLHSLDFVLLFMPIEAAFAAAFQADENLFADAFDRRIVVVTPTTLLATLRTIENIWRYEHQHRNAQLIAERAGAIYDKLRGFVEDMERLGQQLDAAAGSYEAAMTKLSQGRGNLVRQAEGFRELGVKVKRELPRTLLERSDTADSTIP